MNQIMETEIICISDSDESDSQKENKKKSSPVNSTEGNNNALRTKVESSPNTENGEKAEENNLKRKISHISDMKRNPSYPNASEKRKKLNIDQNSSRLDKDDKSGCNQKSNKVQAAVMPNLIVKEQKVIHIENNIFPEFINLCRKKSHDSDMEKIVKKLQKRYDELGPEYIGSTNFALFMKEKYEAIMNNNKKLFVYMEEVMNEMKRLIQRKAKKKSNNSVIYDAVPSTSYAADKASTNHVAEVNENDAEYTDSDTKRKIKIIEKTMRKCEKKIKKLEAAEVDFDEDTDSNYIKMERYKQKIVELYNKLCELTGDNTDAERPYLRPKHISATQIVAVDQAITNFINAKISKRNQSKKPGSLANNLIFPDYMDILECINRCNEKRNLGLRETARVEMAKKAFTELGEFLQRSRRNDYWDTFSLYLENTEEDPAVKDRELANKLANNRNEGQKKLAAVFEKYVKKEERMKEQNYTSTEDDMDVNKDEDEDEDEEEEENEDEDEEENEDEEEEEEKDKLNDILSLHSSSNEDEETSNVTAVERNNNKTVNVDRDTNRIASNKTEKNVQREKCDKKTEVKTPTKENHVPTSKDENKTATDTGKVFKSPISNAVATSKNAGGTDAKTQADSISTSTTNCADTISRIEEHIAEVVIEAISEEVKLMKDVAARVTTGDVEEMAETEISDMVTEDKVTEISTANASDDKLSDKTKKPVLRVRSFAKPPTTWDDGRQKANKTATQENVPKTTSKNEDLIDLTDESSVSEPVITTSAAAPIVAKRIQLDGKVVPLMKRHQTLVLPSGSNIISVQNITNNYLKVDMRTGQIIAPARNIQAPTIIRVPSTQTATVRQSQVQSTNHIATINKAPANRNETILRIIPKKTLVVQTSDPKVIQKAQVRVMPLTKPK